MSRNGSTGRTDNFCMSVISLSLSHVFEYQTNMGAEAPNIKPLQKRNGINKDKYSGSFIGLLSFAGVNQQRLGATVDHFGINDNFFYAFERR